MSRFLKISAVAVGLTCLFGCSEKSAELGPVETVEAFCKAITVGEWDKAETLCDTGSMGDYLDSHKEAWEELQKEDSNIVSIAQSIVAGTVLTVVDTYKEDDKRVVEYTLTADGNSKVRKATLRKEEGAWKVEKITNAN